MEKYVKGKMIGEGAFGKAYLAQLREARSGKQVVLKEINMNRMTQKERNEARKEVSVLAQLKHSNIVSYLESFEESGNLFIVMDYCDGGDLFAKINGQRGLLFTEEQILDWFVQMCLAIKHIHDRKILHRDIKSQNIFMTKHGMLKLGDFGIAKVLNSTVELARTCIGTPYYLSPEICEAKPYNNKSDIWSLGCVLYELMTLKHPFEAGNMKMLVMKIVRASYAPPSSKYTLDLRSLVSLLFKRNPRERPSVNAILKKPLLQQKIRKFLSDSEIQEEFDHTVIHNYKAPKLGQVPDGRPLPQPPPPKQGQKLPTPPSPHANIAQIYGTPAVRKSNPITPNRKSVDAKQTPAVFGTPQKKPAGGNARPQSAGPPPATPLTPPDFVKKKQEFIDKEKERREELKKKEKKDTELAKQHKELMEKQKLARMNQQREEGWKNVLGSGDKDLIAGAVNSNGSGDRNVNGQHAAVRKQEDPRPLPQCPEHNKQPELTPAQAAAKAGQEAADKGAHAADQAKLLEEYLQRKRAADAYKARARGFILPSNPPAIIKPTWVVGPPPPVQMQNGPFDHKPDSIKSKEDAEKKRQDDEYHAKLRQIRLQNFNERRMQKDHRAAVVALPNNNWPAAAQQQPVHPMSELELRRKKVEALRAQAEDRAKALKDELEQRRRESAEPDAKKQPISRPISAPQSSSPTRSKQTFDVSPSGLTAAMAAIGVTPPSAWDERPINPAAVVTPETRPIIHVPTPCNHDVRASMDSREKTPLQKTKDEILKRINSKPPTPLKPESASKWHINEESQILSRLDLEETASKMEATTDQNRVSHPNVKPGAVETCEPTNRTPPRRQWAPSRGTIVNVLNNASMMTDLDGEGVVIDDLDSSAKIDTESQIADRDLSALDEKDVGAEKRVVIESKDDQQKKSHLIHDVKLDDDDDNDQEEIILTNIHTDKNKISRTIPEAFVATKSQKLTDDALRKSPPEATKLAAAAKHVHGSNEQLFTPASVKQGLTTGHFDADAKLLRTCSVPDLSRFSHVASASAERRGSSGGVERAAILSSVDDLRNESVINDDDNDDDDDDTAFIAAAQLLLASTDEADDLDESLSGVQKILSRQDDIAGTDVCNHVDDKKEKKNRDNDEMNETLLDATINDDNDDDTCNDSEEDMKTLRESLADILEQPNGSGDEEPLELNVSGTKKKKSSKKKKMKTTKKSKAILSTSDNNEGLSSMKKVWSDTSLEELESMKQTMKSLLQPDHGTEKSPARTSGLSTIAESSVSSDFSGKTQASSLDGDSTLVPSRESVNCFTDDDDDKLDDEYFEDDESMYSRLEEIRANLESELGFDTFLKAYKTVQSLQETDADNMDDDIKAVTKLLGPDKVQMYPLILQLVMADAAFAEDNN